MDGWIQFLEVSAVVMGMSHTIAKERMFAPLRERLGGKKTWLGYLVSCPYCASHWLAFVLVPLTGIYVIDIPYAWGWFALVLEWFLASILVTVAAGFFRIVFYLVDEAQSLTRSEKRVVQHAEDAPDTALTLNLRH